MPGQNRHTIICEWISDYLLSFLSHVLLPISSSYFLLVLYFKKMYLQQWDNIIPKFFPINLWKLMLGSTHSFFYCSVAVGDLPFFSQVLTEKSITIFFSYFFPCPKWLPKNIISSIPLLLHPSLPSITGGFLPPIPGNVQGKCLHISHKSLR